MKFLRIIFLLIPLLSCYSQDVYEQKIPENAPSFNDNGNYVLAKVGDKEIYLDEFIRRAEYTIRPPYCNGSTNIEKMIVLNTLIAEKLLVLEAGKKSRIYNNDTFLRYIQGRKEQAMRQILFLDLAYNKVEIDSTEVLRRFELAERKYQIKFLNVDNKEIADSAIKIFRDTKSSFENTFEYLTGIKAIPTKEVEYFSQEFPIIHDSLFSRKLQMDEVIGPVSIDDTTYLILKVDGWTVRKNLLPETNRQIYSDLEEEIKNDKADKLYKNFMSKIIKGKEINFYKDTFIPLVNALGPIYLSQSNKMKELFLFQEFEKENPPQNLAKYDEDIEKLINEPLFEVDGKIYTVNDFEEYLDIHPLVFRKKRIKKFEFAEQLKLAIVDAIRDKYVTEIAYKRGIDKDQRVVHYTEMFEDAIISLYEKKVYLNKINEGNLNQQQLIEKYLNPYVKELQHKYSENIEIDVELFNGIELTNTNLFVTQSGAPFPIVVPAFPILTSNSRLDYGKRMIKK
jgi:hypothetical protein